MKFKILLLLSFLYTNLFALGSFYDSAAARLESLNAEVSSRVAQGMLRIAGTKILPIITVVSSDTITIGTGTYCAYLDPAPYDGTTRFSCSSATFQLVDNLEYYYVYADYNGGNSLLRMSQNVNDINTFTTIAVATFIRLNQSIDYIDWGESGNAVPEKNTDRNVRTNRFQRESTGLILNVSSTPFPNCPTVSEGYVWHGTVRQLYPDFDSAISSVSMLMRVGGEWTEFGMTSFPNSHYDDGDLKPLGTGLYGRVYFYRCMGYDNDLYGIVDSTGYTTQQLAIEAPGPSALPIRIQGLSLFVGRAIFVAGSSVPYVESAFNLSQTNSGGGGAIAHNNTTGIQGGGAGDYQHLHTGQLTIVNEVSADTTTIALQLNTTAQYFSSINSTLTSQINSTGAAVSNLSNILTISTSTLVVSDKTLLTQVNSTGTAVSNLSNTFTVSTSALVSADSTLTSQINSTGSALTTEIANRTTLGLQLNTTAQQLTDTILHLNTTAQSLTSSVATLTAQINSTGTAVTNLASSMTITYQSKLDFTASTSTYKNVFALIPIVMSSVGVNVTAYNRTTDISISTIVITQTGSKNSSVIGEIDINSTRAATVTISLYRDSTLLRSFNITTAGGTGNMNYPMMWFSNTNSSTAGLLTYTLRIRSDSTGTTQQVVGYSWRVMEQ